MLRKVLMNLFTIIILSSIEINILAADYNNSKDYNKSFTSKIKQSQNKLVYYDTKPNDKNKSILRTAILLILISILLFGISALVFLLITPMPALLLAFVFVIYIFIFLFILAIFACGLLYLLYYFYKVLTDKRKSKKMQNEPNQIPN